MPQHGPAITLSAVASGVADPAKSGDGPSRPTSKTAESATPDAKCTKKICQRIGCATFSRDAHEPHRKSAVNAKASDASSELG